jgi:hypothetical protein
MTIFQLNKGYPLKHNRQLETKKDANGKTYMFTPSHFIFVSHTTIKVIGLDDRNIWCQLSFKAKSAPKWLQRCMRDAHRNLQAVS